MYSLLIVDDEAATREGLIRLPLWGPLGIRRILQAADGREALEILDRTSCSRTSRCPTWKEPSWPSTPALALKT